MAEIVQAAPELNLTGRAGSPFTHTVTVAVTGTGATWSSLSNFAVIAENAHEDVSGVVPTVTVPTTGKVQLSWTAAQTALLDKVYGTTWALTCSIFGSGPYPIIAGDLTMGDPTSPGTSVSSAAALTVAVGSTAVSLTMDVVGAGGAIFLTRTAVKTGNYTAAAYDLVPCDVTSGSFTVTLPTAPANGTRVAAKIITASGTNTVTIAAAGSDVFNKTSGSTSLTLSLSNQAMTAQYDSGIWTVTSDDLPLAQLDARYDAAGLAAAVQGNLSTEASARANADSALSSAIGSEATSRANADTTLQANITAEAARAAAAEATKAPGKLSAFATSAAAAGRYDPLTNIYNANNSNLLAFRTALAAAQNGTGQCRIAIGPGDSTYTGVTAGGTSDVRGTGDVATLLGQMLNTRAGLPSIGSGLIPGASIQPDSRVTRVGFTNRPVYTPSVANGNTVTFTPGSTQIGTAVRLYYSGQSAAFTWTIDGAAQAAPSIAHGATIQCIEVTGLSNTAHVVVVTASAANVFIIGCEVGYPSSGGGISVSNLAVSGSGTQNGSGFGWKDVAVNYSYIWPLLKMPTALDGTAGQTSKPMPFHLITIGLLINDWGTNVDPATYKSTLATIITTLQALSPAPSIILTVSAQAYNGSDSTPTYAWTNYVQALYQLADTYNLPLVDYGDRWSAPGNTDVQNWTLANGLGLMTTANPFHPSALGYREQADALFSLLTR